MHKIFHVCISYRLNDDRKDECGGKVSFKPRGQHKLSKLEGSQCEAAGDVSEVRRAMELCEK